jgi:hypothetical protein
MTTTPEIVRGFHRALHVACGLAPLSPSANDNRVWWEFLLEMAALEEPEIGGPLTVQDIQDVVGEMRRQNKAQQANWSIRPSKILRNPEDFRDMVLMARKRRLARPFRPTTALVERQDGDIHRQVETKVEHEPIPVAEALEMLRAHMK